MNCLPSTLIDQTLHHVLSLPYNNEILLAALVSTSQQLDTRHLNRNNTTVTQRPTRPTRPKKTNHTREALVVRLFDLHDLSSSTQAKETGCIIEIFRFRLAHLTFSKLLRPLSLLHVAPGLFPQNRERRESEHSAKEGEGGEGNKITNNDTRRRSIHTSKHKANNTLNTGNQRCLGVRQLGRK